jgi:hypothetical protein
VVRRATPATLPGVAGRPTRASALLTKAFGAVTEKLSPMKRPPIPTIAANTILHNLCLPLFIVVSFLFIFLSIGDDPNVLLMYVNHLDRRTIDAISVAAPTDLRLGRGCQYDEQDEVRRIAVSMERPLQADGVK